MEKFWSRFSRASVRWLLLRSLFRIVRYTNSIARQHHIKLHTPETFWDLLPAEISRQEFIERFCELKVGRNPEEARVFLDGVKRIMFGVMECFAGLHNVECSLCNGVCNHAAFHKMKEDE